MPPISPQPAAFIELRQPIAAVNAHGLKKAFGVTIAVDDVSFIINSGQVHALLGENGAGKSTIVKMLSGLIVPDAGSLELFGSPARIVSPRAAHSFGIQTAFQEMTLIRDLTVLENLLLPYAPVGPAGMIRRRAARGEVAAHFQTLDLSHINLEAEVRDLDLADRQKIEIARALFRKPKLLMLDEPTSTLSGRDVDWLGQLIAQERVKGTTVVFISHRLREVRAFCDKLTVLRNGRHIVTGSTDEFSDEDIIRQIVGRSIGQVFPPRLPSGHLNGADVFAAKNLSAGRARNVDFTLREGEILGVAGLQGMGQLELFLACFGMEEVTGGHLEVDGRAVSIAAPSDAVNANIGISLLPEDRKTEALFLKLTGLHNVSLPVIDRFTRFGVIQTDRERDAVRSALARVDVDERALWTRVSAFSGGNQQKIAIAKWLLAESRVLLLYDPTRGIDVGTKHELYELMRDYAASGGTILFYSTEIPELVHLCDRVMVFYQGHVAALFNQDRLSEETIVAAALGGEPEALRA